MVEGCQSRLPCQIRRGHIEQLDEKGTALVGHGGGAAADPAKVRRAQEGTVVKTQKQKWQGSNPASACSKVYDLGNCLTPLCLGFPILNGR